MGKVHMSKRLGKMGVYLSLFSFIPITGLEMICDLKIFVLLRAFCCLSACIHYVMRRKTSPLMLSIIIFVIWLESVTGWYRGISLRSIYEDLIIVSACAFFDYQIKENRIEFLQMLYWYCCITISLNLFSILLVPKGLYLGDPPDVGVHFLLGNYNTFIIHILPAVCVGYHLMVEGRIFKRQYIFLWIIVIATYLLRTSMSSVIGLFVFGSFLLLFNKKVWRIIFNQLIYVISIAIAVYLVVFARYKSILYYLSSITGKNITLSGRTRIWSNMIDLLPGHCIAGYGKQDTSELVNMLNFYHAQHAHNLVLQVIWQGGCIGIILFGIIMMITIYTFLKTSDNKVVRCYGCALFALSIMSIAEFYGYRVIFSMIVIFSGCCNIINSLKSKKGDAMLENTL